MPEFFKKNLYFQTLIKLKRPFQNLKIQDYFIMSTFLPQFRKKLHVNNIVLLKKILFFCLIFPSVNAQNMWTWVSGYSVSDAVWSEPRPNPQPFSVYDYNKPWVLDEQYKPSVREHAAGGLVDNTAMYMYGGATLEDYNASDFWMYDLVQQKWALISLKGVGLTYGTIGVENAYIHPGGRNRSASAVDKDGNFWLFGGLYKDRPSGNEFSMGDLWKFSKKTKKWTYYGNHTNANNSPLDRHRARAWFDENNNFWIYGGAINGWSYNDMWMFNTTTLQWTHISGNKNNYFTENDPNGNYPANVGMSGTQYFPKARSDYGYWKDKTGNFWIYGGYTVTHGLHEYGDFWKFNPVTNEWTLIAGSSQIDTPKTATYPGSRNAPYCWVGNDGKLYMQGGLRLWDNFLSDTWRYNIDTNTWEIVVDRPVNQAPTIAGYRVEHSSNAPGAQVCTLNHVTTGSHTYMYDGYGKGSNARQFYDDYSKPFAGFTGAVWRYTLDGYNPSLIPVAMQDQLKTYTKDTIAYSVLTNDLPQNQANLKGIDIDTSLAGLQDTLKTNFGKYWLDQSSGVILFAPVTGFTGTTSLHYTFQNQSRYSSNNGLYQLTIYPTNQNPELFPIAVNDTLKASFQAKLYELITKNDSFKGELDELTIDIDSLRHGIQDSLITTSGRFKMNTGGILEFSPENNFVGDITLGYTFQNKNGFISNLGKINFTVFPPNQIINQQPLTVNDTLITRFEADINFNIIKNDTIKGTLNNKLIDIDVLKTGYQDSIITANGKVIIDTLGILHYYPNIANTVVDTIRLKYNFKNSANYLSNTGNITIIVLPLDYQSSAFPKANDDNFILTVGTSNINFDILSNDLLDIGTVTNIQLDSLTIMQNESNINTDIGVFSINPLNKLYYTPTVSQKDSIVLYYRFQNANHFRSNIAKIKIGVNICNSDNILLDTGNNLANGIYEYVTNGHIIANNKLIQTNLPLNTTFNSAKSITLLPGFETTIQNAGSTFKTNISGCN